MKLCIKDQLLIGKVGRKNQIWFYKFFLYKTIKYYIFWAAMITHQYIEKRQKINYKAEIYGFQNAIFWKNSEALKPNMLIFGFKCDILILEVDIWVMRRLMKRDFYL